MKLFTAEDLISRINNRYRTKIQLVRDEDIVTIIDLGAEISKDCDEDFNVLYSQSSLQDEGSETKLMEVINILGKGMEAIERNRKWVIRAEVVAKGARISEPRSFETRYDTRWDDADMVKKVMEMEFPQEKGSKVSVWIECDGTLRETIGVLD